MALLWIEGFDSFGTGPNESGIDEKYQGSFLSSVDIEPGRFGDYCIQMAASSIDLRTPDLGDQTTIITGFAFNAANFDSNMMFFIREDNNSTLGVNIESASNGALRVRRGTTDLAESRAGIIREGTWHYIELKVTIHNTTGSFELRVDGETILSDTNVDTQAGSNGNADVFGFNGNGASNDYKYDDWYICNSSGSVNNDFLGPLKVQTLFPDGDGDVSSWTPDSGNNYQRVDENPSDGDTSYVETATANNEDLYTFENTSDIDSINGLQINAVARVTDVDPFTLKLISKTGTTTSAGAGATVSATSYGNEFRVMEQDPDTAAAWTPAGVNGAQFGIEME